MVPFMYIRIYVGLKLPNRLQKACCGQSCCLSVDYVFRMEMSPPKIKPAQKKVNESFLFERSSYINLLGQKQQILIKLHCAVFKFH